MQVFAFVTLLLSYVFANVEIDEALLKDYVKVPGGRLMHKSCVHHAPEGSRISRDASQNLMIHDPVADVTIVHPPCPHRSFFTPSDGVRPKPRVATREKRDEEDEETLDAASDARLTHGPAWKAWTQYNATSPVTRFSTAWTVPAMPPQNDGQILYYWNGIEPEDNSAVLQPVLQWGYTPAGGGAYWAMASWYVSASNVVFSNVIRCGATGTNVLGQLAVGSGGNWQVVSTCGSSKASLSYNPSTDPPYTWAYPCVLEAYNIIDCVKDYPTYRGSQGSLTFTGIELEIKGKPFTTSWTPQTKNNICGENANAISQTSVQIVWQ